MKANELMVGDWVNISPSQYRDGFVGRVAEVYSDSIFTAGGKYEGENVDEVYVYPVKLTADILRENGFVKIGDGYLMTGRPAHSFALRSVSDGLFVARIGDRCVIFAWVHELQHALKLCRIEKEIKL